MLDFLENVDLAGWSARYYQIAPKKYKQIFLRKTPPAKSFKKSCRSKKCREKCKGKDKGCDEHGPYGWCHVELFLEVDILFVL